MEEPNLYEEPKRHPLALVLMQALLKPVEERLVAERAVAVSCLMEVEAEA
jgi:hypothetical protein